MGEAPMSTSTQSGRRRRAPVTALLALACLTANALADGPPAAAPSQAAAEPATGPAPAVGVLPPAVTSGGDPAAPASPQGLGIGGVSGTSGLIGVPLRMVLEVGNYRCDLNRRVAVRSIAPDRSSLTISWLGKDHSLTAVDARSGALRFENAGAGLIWLVIVGKSMLLDSRKGQQLANDCTL